MGEKLVLIDGHSILNRAFYGMPDLTNAGGVHTGAVYGFLNILFKILDEEKADYLTVAFDVHAPTFRHKVYKDYKGTRRPMPPELREQVPLMKKVLKAMGVQTREQAGLEADDILGTLAKRAEADGMEVALVSGDRDLLQIASDHICVRIPKTIRGQTVIEDYRTQDVIDRYRVTPSQFIDVKALMGDSSDNVPGVPKVGEKTATQLIVDYGSVEGVYEHLDDIRKPALRRNLAENEELAKLSLFLVTIKTDCDIPISREEARIGNLYTPEAFELYTELNFRAFLPRFDTSAVTEDKEEFHFEEITHTEQFGTLQEQIIGAVRAAGEERTYTVGLYPVIQRVRYGEEKQSSLLGLAVSVPERDVFLTVSETLTQETLTGFLHTLRREVLLADTRGGSRAHGSGARSEDSSAGLEEMPGRADMTEEAGGSGSGRSEAGSRTDRSDGGAVPEPARIALFNVKLQYPFWGIDPDIDFRDGIHLEGIADLLIECYLINPLQSDYQPEMIASEYLSESLPTVKQVFGKKSASEAMKQQHGEAVRYACRAARALRLAAGPVHAKLSQEGMVPLYRRIERPLSYILYDMERIGIRIHPEALREYSARLGARIDELTGKIYEECGEKFNIASPRQLGTVLFEKMGLPGGKKTKTGYSTAAGVLEKLAPDYPVVRDVLEYRALAKLKSTYADGLTAFVSADGKIHTSFNQTITATGRISSTEPNLQNIPMKTELGKRIRKAFVPGEGMSFTDADYSQIELRILAHMSGDRELIEAYRSNKDIHRITASKVFHTPFEDVTPLQRRNAKAVNFGIVYGISSFGLSQGLSISRKEAAEYIDAYFKTYPGIKTFLDGLVASAREKGYAVTLYGRRRPVPELKSSNFMQRSFGERVAMNSPIQGSAADIMKIAMIRVWEKIHSEGLESELILQIHDELLVETAPGEEQRIRELLAYEMGHAADLSVSLETDVHSGSDWYMAK